MYSAATNLPLHVSTFSTNVGTRAQSWSFPSSYTGHRAVCRVETDDTNANYCAWIGGGAYVPGDPFGIYLRPTNDLLRSDAPRIELTATTALFDRINLYTGMSSRHGKGTPVAKYDIERVRIVPYAVRGTKQDYADPSLPDDYVIDIVTNGLAELRVAADFYIDRNNHSVITEADVIDEVNGKLDLDWDGWVSGYFTSQPMKNAVGDVTLVKYRVILGEGSYLGPLGNLDVSDGTQSARVFSFPIERRFESSSRRTLPTVISPVGGGVVHSARPTFRWRLDEPATVTHGYGCSYTAFRIQVLDESGKTVICDSDLQRVPVRDANGEFVWTAPISIGMALPGGGVFENGSYTWRVLVYNAKFRNPLVGQNATGTFAMAAGLQ